MDIIDTWVYEINPVRHVFIVSYGTRYTGTSTLPAPTSTRSLAFSTMRRPWAYTCPSLTRPPSPAGANGSASVAGDSQISSPASCATRSADRPAYEAVGVIEPGELSAANVGGDADPGPFGAPVPLPALPCRLDGVP